MHRKNSADADVDIVVLTRDLSPLRPDVRNAILSQFAVNTTLLRVWGRKGFDDEHRIETIARARNLGKKLGDASYLMFVDDDVVLEANCCLRLVRFLEQNPNYAACGANYAKHVQDKDEHVSMGATLFRRTVLDQINFRFEEACECLTCCRDLEKQGWKIGYCPDAIAHHVSRKADKPHPSRVHVTTRLAGPVSPDAAREAHVLCAFDRSHWRRWKDQFLQSLRQHGNHVTVHAVGYGLPPSTRRRIARLPNVELTSKPANTTAVPVRRLDDFQPILSALPSDSPVAYWDAADVVFQDSLIELWSLVLENTDQLLACAEPKWYPENTAVKGWTDSIIDPPSRRAVFELLRSNPFLNSGFAAGSAGSMLRYLRDATTTLHSKTLWGTADWGDQTVFNLYCHTHPDRWKAIDPAWNYCTHDRGKGAIRVGPDGRVYSRDGDRISVAHGNAKSLRQFEIRPMVTA